MTHKKITGNVLNITKREPTFWDAGCILSAAGSMKQEFWYDDKICNALTSIEGTARDIVSRLDPGYGDDEEETPAESLSRKRMVSELGIHLGMEWATLLQSIGTRKEESLIWDLMREEFQKTGGMGNNTEVITTAIIRLEQLKKAGVYTGKIPNYDNLQKKFKARIKTPFLQRGRKQEPPFRKGD